VSTVPYSDRGRLPAWAFGGFVRPAGVNPLLSPDPDAMFDCPMHGGQVAWESGDTFNPAAVVRDGRVCVLYRAEDRSGVGIGSRTSRIGLAESSDGIRLSRRSTPVLFPTDDDQRVREWPGGCEDPRIAVTEDGTYVLMYTQWDRTTARLAVATSRDLLTWTKHGPVFVGRFRDLWSKAGALVTQVVDGRQVIARIAGKYWMYWGEFAISVATSDDLIHWDPLLDPAGEPVRLVSPRDGFFDSDLAECGPPAVMTEHGILLLYNGKNSEGEKGDRRFNASAYCAGQVLFDLNDPTRVLARLDEPFLRPMEPFERSGQYVDGTVFIQGLAFLDAKWFLYYGCADSRVAVAVYDPANPSPPDPLPEP